MQAGPLPYRAHSYQPGDRPACGPSLQTSPSPTSGLLGVSPDFLFWNFHNNGTPGSLLGSGFFELWILFLPVYSLSVLFLNKTFRERLKCKIGDSPILNQLCTSWIICLPFFFFKSSGDWGNEIVNKKLAWRPKFAPKEWHLKSPVGAAEVAQYMRDLLPSLTT